MHRSPRPAVKQAWCDVCDLPLDKEDYYEEWLTCDQCDLRSVCLTLLARTFTLPAPSRLWLWVAIRLFFLATTLCLHRVTLLYVNHTVASLQ